MEGLNDRFSQLEVKQLWKHNIFLKEETGTRPIIWFSFNCNGIRLKNQEKIKLFLHMQIIKIALNFSLKLDMNNIGNLWLSRCHILQRTKYLDSQIKYFHFSFL